MTSVKLTDWEEQLVRVAHGEPPAQTFTDGIRTMTAELVQNAHAPESNPFPQSHELKISMLVERCGIMRMEADYLSERREYSRKWALLIQGEYHAFVFAKENCFNGVSIPKELIPILKFERVVAVDRKNSGGSMAAIKAAKKWFDEGKKPKHFLIFAQGTIYDINKDRAEDIERGAFWLARLLGIPVLPAFIEQAVEGAENRLVFGQSMSIPKSCRDFENYKELWLEKVIEAQNELAELTGIPARKAVLDEEHQTRKKLARA